MNHHYNDIRSRIAEPPSWFDENAVPRYCPFSPDETANIYAKEVVLLRVACQNCERDFDVCMSWSDMDHVRGVERLSRDIKERKIRYGDPPNVECCASGPTMNSVPIRVLEFWRHPDLPRQSNPNTPYRMPADAPRWERVPALEIEVTPGWAADR